MSRPVNAQYSILEADSLPVRIAARMRRVMYARFLEATALAPDETVLDVGATSERSYEASNYLERWYPHKHRVTAVGLDDAAFLETEFPGMRFVRANGLALPFADRSFDVVHSSAVLEHVGDAANQRAFVAELCRVARRAVFVTTPNRWFPIEFHSVLPLVHWLPKPTFRRILKALGHEALSREENLNLLTRRELRACIPRGFEGAVSMARLGGWGSNLLLPLRRVD